MSALGPAASRPPAQSGASTPPAATAPHESGSPAPSSQQPSPTKPAASPSPASSGQPPITGSLAGIDWTYIPTTRHVVALTFDAGANADGVSSILATVVKTEPPSSDPVAAPASDSIQINF